MNLLKKKNWFIWLLLTFIGGGSGTIALAALLDCIEEDAWYMNWKYWLIGALLLFLPFSIMVSVFAIQMTCVVASKLNVPGKELYLGPYIWLVMIIVPIIGWIAFVLFLLYLQVAIIVALAKGEGEKYIK